MMQYQARAEYDRVSGMLAFNIQGYVTKARNGAATWYDFADGSRLKLLKRGAIVCGPHKNEMHAIRQTFARTVRTNV